MVASLKEEMKLTKGVQVKRADVEKLASRFLEEYQSSVDESGITAGLLKMFNYIWNNPDKNGETAAIRPAKGAQSGLSFLSKACETVPRPADQSAFMRAYRIRGARAD